MKRIHYTAPYVLAPTHRLTVNLAGTGGTGSRVLTALGCIDRSLHALGHPGLHVTAFDPDIVTEANIGRQLFSPSDMGLNKASVLVTRINRFLSLDWEAVPELFPDCADPANITVSCVDSARARIDIAGKLSSVPGGVDHRKPLYWLDFGNTVNAGQVVLGTLTDIEQPPANEYETVSSLKTVAELFDLASVDEKASGPSCSLAEALQRQDLFINSSLAQLGCNLLWKLISTGCIDMQGLYLNLETMRVNPIKL
ncbi:MAG: PRTRC system ThiF family protein [Tannerellaceae bacterium]|jgi:PRTRC genetic system ThiF family protein|nr:PRTRC system ThiF family protein [Tannerellaceae bacterium]